jgi:hypoxanthine phosphoribosyltransferase
VTHENQLPAHTLETVLSKEVLKERVRTLASEINAYYAQCPELTVIGVLNGAVFFLTDLVRQFTMPCRLEFIKLASYENRTTSSGNIKPVDLTLPNLTGKEVLIVEDILDTGLTLRFLMTYLHTVHHPKSLRSVVLLDKPSGRKQDGTSHSQETPSPNWIGFAIEPDFVVGYGLDYAGLYRNLPSIAKVCFPEGAP